MIDERLEDAYRKDIEKLEQINAKLKEENHILSEKMKYIESERVVLQAQMEVVHLIFGRYNR